MSERAVAPPGPGTALARRVVGRDRELAQLSAALNAAAEGRGSMVFLAGEAGIGKSRLTQAVASDAAGHGFTVLRGRAVPAATPVAYRPLAEALCSAVRADPKIGGTDLDPYREILGLLVPEWRVEHRESIEESVVAVAEAVLRFLRAAAARRGCLLVLEDLHWSDPETLRISEYLADNLTSERVLCVATLRTDDTSAGFELAKSLHARRVSPVVEIPRLTRFELAEMVGSCLDSSNVPDVLVEFAARADGVPFLVEELLAGAVNSGALVAAGDSWEVSKDLDHLVPLTFVDGMRRRLASLGETTRALLLAAAVLGRRFDWTLLAPMTGRTEDEVLAHLRRAIDAQVVTVDEGGSSFRFRHALSRDAVMADLLPPEMAALARRGLEAVEAAHPELEDEWCELAAELAERSGQANRAGRLLLEAARRALHRGALTSAEANLERAGSVLADDDLLRLDVDELLAQVLSLAGKRERAAAVGGALLARLGHGQETQGRRSEVYLRLARAALAATQAEEAEELLDRATAEMAAGDDGFQARVDAVRAQAAVLRDPDRAPALAEAALEAAERLGLPDVACEALEVLGRTQRRYDLQAAEASFARALSIAGEHGLTLWRARALHELGTVDMLSGGSVERLEEARQMAVVQGALATAAVVDIQIAAGVALGDDPDLAVEPARRSIELARRYGLQQTLAAALALEAHAHARAGRPDDMKRCVDEARSLAPGVPDVEVKLALGQAMAALIEEDRTAAGRHLSATVVPGPTHRGGDYSVSPGAGVLALVRQLEGADGLEVDSGVAEAAVHFMTRAFLLYAAAVAAGRAGDGERAAALVADAGTTLGDHRWLGHLGRRLVAEAAVADGWGDPVVWLRESLGFFDERGEEKLASACRSLLRQAGAPVPRRRGDEIVPGPLRALGVTSREFEVLRLLAAGLPNKKIGARLYLSPRTVERHVANLSTKTGVAARSELVAYAARTVGQVDRA